MKYPIGTRLRKHLTEYEIIGFTVMRRPMPNQYLVLVWDAGNHRGYDILQWDVDIIDREEFSHVELPEPEDVSRETS